MPDSKPNTRAHKHTFPYAITPAQGDDVETLKNRCRGYLSGAVRVGPEGYYMQGIYQDYAQDIYDFAFRSTDVVVASYPKTGTTWTQELVWLLIHNFDYEGAKTRLDTRFPFLEADCVIDRRVFEFPDVAARLEEGAAPPGPWESLGATHSQPDPRAIKTHMPFSLLPPDLLDTCKVIYVTRDPRDVVPSFHHHHKIIASHGFSGTLEEFLQDFLDEKVIYSPFWSHVKEAWALKQHPNLLIVTYEQLKADLTKAIRDIAKFLGIPVTEEQLACLVAHLHIDAMMANSAVNDVGDPIVFPDPKEGGFVRKGASGGRRAQFTDEMKAAMQNWITAKAGGLDKELGWT